MNVSVNPQLQCYVLHAEQSPAAMAIFSQQLYFIINT